MISIKTETRNVESKRGAIERTGTGSIERTGTGSIENTGTGRTTFLSMILVLSALLIGSPVFAQTIHTIGSLTISKTDSEVAVSWHRQEGKRLTLVSGQGFIESGFAVVDLHSSDNPKAQDSLWGQIEIEMSADGTLQGTIFRFSGFEQFEFESGGDANYLINSQVLRKVEAGGTGGGN